MATLLRRAPGKHRAGKALPGTGRVAGSRVSHASPPTLVARSELFRAIAGYSLATAGRETGGPLIGTVQRSWSRKGPGLIVSVLGTVPPATISAGPSWLGLGRSGDGERAVSALRWWRAVTGLELMHLGDWHKHHSGMAEPSEGDRRTAAEMALRSSAPVWLVAVTVGDRQGAEEIEDGHAVRLMRASAMSTEVRFYRQMELNGLVPLVVRSEEEAIPGLPPLPWHVLDPARFAVECRLLRTAGFRVAIDPTRPDGRMGLAIRLSRDGDDPVTVLTGLRYPSEAPATLDGASGKKVRVPWGPHRFLVDLASETGR
jgi:hypothetical protein